MNKFAGIFLHMDTGNSDTFRFIVHADVQPAVLADRLIELADLVSLWKVGIEVVLAGKGAAVGNRAVGSQAGLEGKFNYLFV